MEKNHLEIILEDIQSKFELVLEGHDALRKEIRDAKEESNEKHEHTALLINGLNKKIDGVESRLNKRIDGVESGLTKRIEEVESRLNKRIDGVESGLTKRIDEVENGLTKRIVGLASDLSAHRADTESHRKGYKVSDH